MLKKCCVILLSAFLLSQLSLAAAPPGKNQSGLRVELTKSRAKQSSSKSFGTIAKEELSKRERSKSTGTTRTSRIGGGRVLRPAYSYQLFQSQRRKLQWARSIVLKYNRCRDIQGVGNEMLRLIAQLGKYDTLLTRKSTNSNKRLLASLKQSRTVVSGSMRDIRSMLAKATPKDLKCWSNMNAREAKLKQKRGEILEALSDAAINKAKENYETAKEQFKAAMIILTEHMERQTQAVRKLTG